jgi:hypothetical protein
MAWVALCITAAIIATDTITASWITSSHKGVEILVTWLVAVGLAAFGSATLLFFAAVMRGVILMRKDLSKVSEQLQLLGRDAATSE